MITKGLTRLILPEWWWMLMKMWRPRMRLMRPCGKICDGILALMDKNLISLPSTGKSKMF